MNWAIVHRTDYRYGAAVRESFNEARLLPVSDEFQQVKEFVLHIEPRAPITIRKDFYGNTVHHFDVTQPHAHLVVESRVHMLTRPRPELPPTATPWPLARIGEAAQAPRVFDFLQAGRFVDLSPETWRHAVDVTEGKTDTWQAALALMSFVHGHLSYESASTTVHTHAHEVLKARRGVCQDFAHVFIGLCRSLRIPALYVSGYLATETASATHAWAEVLIPQLGWYGLDPTHNRQVDETYVKIAVGRDYGDVPPVAGIYKGTTERRMEVTVEIRREATPNAQQSDLVS